MRCHMADEADIADDIISKQLAERLEVMRLNMTGKSGSKMCKECGESIPEARRKLGFHLCIECAEEAERRDSLFA